MGITLLACFWLLVHLETGGHTGQDSWSTFIIWIVDHECAAEKSKAWVKLQLLVPCQKRTDLAVCISAHTQHIHKNNTHKHTLSSCICPWGVLVSNSQQECFPYLDSHYRKIPGYGLSQPVHPVLSRNFFKEGRGPWTLPLKPRHIHAYLPPLSYYSDSVYTNTHTCTAWLLHPTKLQALPTM